MRGRPQHTTIGMIVVTAAIGLSLPAVAQTSSELDWCSGKGNPSSERVIRGCTAVIQSSRQTTRNCSTAYNNRGAGYHEQGDNDRAIADYNEAIRLDPKDALAYDNRGNASAAQGRLRPRHRRLQRGDPARSQGRVGLQQPGHRLVPCQEATTTAPSPTTTRRSGSIRSTPSPTTTGATPATPRATYDRAIADYNEAIRLDPKDAAAYNNRGNRLARQGRPRPRHRRLQRGDPARSQVRSRPTTTAASLGQPRATSTAPSPTTARRSGSIRRTPRLQQPRRRVSRRRATIDHAIADYNEAIRLDPKYASRLQQPGRRVCTRRATTTAPSPTTTRRSGSIPSTPSPTTTAATLYHAKGDHDRAIADFSEAIRLDPKYARSALPQPRHARYSVREGRTTTERRSPTTARRSGSIPSRHWPSWTRQRVREGRLRPRDRRLQRGDPARSQGAPPTTPRRSRTATRATTTGPSPTTTRRSGSIPRTFAYIGRDAATRATTTGPSPTTARRSGSIPRP